MSNKVQSEVEAVLLNSEGSPWVEVSAALCGVIRFARNEKDASDDDLREALEMALKSPRSSLGL